MFKLLLSALMVLTSLSAFSDTNLDGFKKRFTLIKDDAGNVTYVQMNLMTKKLSIKPYVNQLKNDIISEIERMRSKDGSLDHAEFFEYLEDNSIKNNEQAQNIVFVKKSLKNLKDINVDKIFAKLNSKGVLENFRKKLQDALNKYSLMNIASTEDPRYFYKRNVTYEVVKRALEFAKKQFSEVPILNIASFVIVKVHDMVLEQRLFHQNMLLHYLQNVSENDLGITVDEADRIFSSIYESRIGYLNYRESQAAANNWTRYGLNKFYAMVRGANNRLRRSQSQFDEVGQRFNFAFFEAKEDGKRVIKNLVHNKHMLSKKMATSYYIDEPDKVRRFRSLLNLAQAGLSFIPVADWLKNQVDGFMDSYYVEQKILEGALIGYFESSGNLNMATQIKKQNINPYIIY